MAKNTSVIGIYSDRATVSEAINVMTKTGYRAADISVLSSDNQGSKDFAHVKQNKALFGAAIGAAIAAVVGAALAWFISTQPVTITALATAGVCRADRGGDCRRGRRRGVGLDRRPAGGHASDRIRRQTLCGTNSAWRYSAIHSLRQSGVV